MFSAQFVPLEARKSQSKAHKPPEKARYLREGNDTYQRKRLVRQSEYKSGPHGPAMSLKLLCPRPRRMRERSRAVLK